MKQFFSNLFAKANSLIYLAFSKAMAHPNIAKLILFPLTFLSFWLLLNWKLGIICVVALTVHEYGHIFALDLLGIKGAQFFPVPFFGGITAYPPYEVKTYERHFIIAIMGPVIGCAFAGICIILYAITGWNLLGAAAGMMVGLNLFNMIPASGLDGGKMYDSIVSGFSPTMQKVSYSLMSAGILAIGLVSFKLYPVVGIILIACSLIQFFTRVRVQLVQKYEPILSPLYVSFCVIAYLVSVLGMLALLLPLVHVNFSVLR